MLCPHSVVLNSYRLLSKLNKAFSLTLKYLVEQIKYDIDFEISDVLTRATMRALVVDPPSSFLTSTLYLVKRGFLRSSCSSF